MYLLFLKNMKATIPANDLIIVVWKGKYYKNLLAQSMSLKANYSHTAKEYKINFAKSLKSLKYLFYASLNRSS